MACEFPLLLGKRKVFKFFTADWSFEELIHFVTCRPLESEVSVWDYQLVATDSKGLDVSDRLDIHVQQHKLSRTVNHEFVLYLRIDKRSEFPNSVDWELKVSALNSQ